MDHLTAALANGLHSGHCPHHAAGSLRAALAVFWALSCPDWMCWLICRWLHRQQQGLRILQATLQSRSCHLLSPTPPPPAGPPAEFSHSPPGAPAPLTPLRSLLAKAVPSDATSQLRAAPMAHPLEIPGHLSLLAHGMFPMKGWETAKLAVQTPWICLTFRPAIGACPTGMQAGRQMTLQHVWDLSKLGMLGIWAHRLHQRCHTYPLILSGLSCANGGEHC